MGGCFCSCCGFLSRSRDVRPAAHLLSFASPKESRQRKGDPTVCDPFACGERGNLCRAGRGVHRGTHFAALQLRSNSRGESELKRVRPAAHPPPHALPAPGASTREWGSHTGHRCARPPARERCAARPSAAMARVGCWLFNSLLYAPRSAAGGVACVPQDTQASLSSLPQLFERSAASAQ